ncbi:MAG: FMN-binding protein [Bacilli bacterium]
MKKILSIIFCLGFILLTGCAKVGDYKEGTYLGSVEYESYGKKYVTTAVVYVNTDGVIKSCFIDSTYVTDDINTTKKTLGDDYGMKDTSAQQGIIEGGAEWYEQVEVIEEKVVSEQGLDWVVWSDGEETKLDSISGVTITADTYIEAIEKALSQAK